jgi:two-component system cell cycle response regulator
MPGKILIVDDVATNRIVLKVKLADACYDTLQAASGHEALAIARREAPDLVLLDHNLPDCKGPAVVRALRADPATTETPVIMFSAAADTAIRREAFAAGADGFVGKPMDDQVLLARIRRLLRERDALAELHDSARGLGGIGVAEAGADFDRPGVVAVLAPRREAAMRWRAQLGAMVRCTIDMPTREEALSGGGRPPADLFLIDGGSGPGPALELVSDLRSRPASRDAAVCVLLPGPDARTESFALDLGANDVLDDRLDPAEFGLRIAAVLRRKRHADRLRREIGQGLRLASVDPLTGLHNRRYALPALHALIDRARDAGRRCAVMVIDIDRFKSVNDRFGHSVGDAVLAEIAARLSAAASSADLIARIGGEEFLAAFTGLDEAEAMVQADRLCRAVEARPVSLPGVPGGGLAVTVSIGLAVSAPAETLAGGLFERADAALFDAKRDGRNRVTCARDAVA